jgi:hypothetical protein
MHAWRSIASTPRPWALLILLLLVLRIPSLVAPTGNDQNLYLYTADRIRAGGVPYVDAWDQKPPAVHFIYAALRSVWPHPSVVAAADLLAAAIVAWLLVLLGQRLIGPGAGPTAAALYVLFSDPALQRLNGVYVRGQCETFIALAVTAAIALTTQAGRGRWHAGLAGVALGMAIWLKYNAVAYVLPAIVCLWLNPPTAADRRSALAREVGAVVGGVLVVSAAFLSYFVAHGAVTPWWHATIGYNLAYAGDTYSGPMDALTYLLRMPFGRARLDLLWFLGGVGILVVVMRRHPVAPLVVAWVVSAAVAIGLNGARDLPQYFVQAAPALAFSGAAGLRLARRGSRPLQVVTVLAVVLGLWKVGVEPPGFAGLRWGGVPQLVDNVRFDTAYLFDRVSRDEYLARFRGGQKYDAAAVDDLAQYVRDTTASTDRILVFGFAPGVYVGSGRLSASRFFWSRPVIVEFDAADPSYGSRGLLRDLHAHPPTIVALQKRDWYPDVQNSMDFFLGNDGLSAWLAAGYVLDRDTPVFSVWRRSH